MSTATPSRTTPTRTPSPRPRAPQKTTGFTSTVDPIRVLRRHFGTIVFMTFLGIVVGIIAHVLLLINYPLYKSEVLFEVRAGLTDSTQVASNETLNDDLVFRIAKSETILLTSREVLSEAMEHPEIMETTWHKGFIDESGQFNRDDAVDALEESVGAIVVRGSNFFLLQWSTHEATDVPIILNRIASAYMAKRQRINESMYTENINLFRDELAKTNRDIADLDQQIAQFIREQGITTLDDPRYSGVAYALERLTDQMTTVRSSHSIARSNFEQTAAKLLGTMEPSSDDLLEAEGDPALQPHIHAALSHATELRVLRDKYDDDHRLVQDAEARLAAIQAEKDAKMEEILRRNLEARHKLLQDEIERWENMILQVEQDIQEKDATMRDLAADQTQYEALKTQRERLELQRDSDMQLIKEVQLMRLRADASQIRMAQHPQTPREKSFPKPYIIVPLAMLLFVGATIVFVFLREIADQRIKGANDLAVISGAKVLGVIPDIEDDPTNVESPELVIWKHPQSVLAESYRQAWAPVGRVAERHDFRTLLILSGLPNAGTSTVAGNVAATAAASGKRVLLVDANFRRPRLAEMCGVGSDAVGLGDVLGGEAILEQAIVDVERGVHLLPAGSPGSRVIERLGTRDFAHLIAELRDKFDLVVFDAAPAVVAYDALALANQVDATMLVVRANQEQRGLVARLINQITDAHSELVGVLLNRPRGTAGGYLKKNYATMAEYAASSGE